MNPRIPVSQLRRPARWHATLSAVAIGGLGGGGLGGGGLGRGLVHLFIWRLLWRGGVAIWRVPTFGPPIDIILGIAVLAAIVVRSSGGRPNWPRRGGPGGTGTGTGSRDAAGPRNW